MAVITAHVLAHRESYRAPFSRKRTRHRRGRQWRPSVINPVARGARGGVVFADIAMAIDPALSNHVDAVGTTIHLVGEAAMADSALGDFSIVALDHDARYVVIRFQRWIFSVR